MARDSGSYGASHGYHRHGDGHDLDGMLSHLLSEERREWQDPEKILDAVLPAGVGTVVEVGCGPGYFTLPLARRIGSGGTVIALDVNATSLSVCRQRLLEANLHNFELLRLDADRFFPLADGSADFILLANVLHDLKRPQKTLSDALKLLKKNGRAVDIDWKKESLPFGPPPEIKFSSDHSRDLLIEAGFRDVSVSEIGPYHYCVLGTK